MSGPDSVSSFSWSASCTSSLRPFATAALSSSRSICPAEMLCQEEEEEEEEVAGDAEGEAVRSPRMPFAAVLQEWRSPRSCPRLNQSVDLFVLLCAFSMSHCAHSLRFATRRRSGHQYSRRPPWLGARHGRAGHAARLRLLPEERDGKVAAGLLVSFSAAA